MAFSQAGLYHATSQLAFETWYAERKPSKLFTDRLELHDFVVEKIGADTPLRYLEFGVHSGYSLKRFASKFTNPRSEFVGFDSFLGLPEQWHEAKAGHFSTDGRFPETDDSRIQFKAGWFQNSTQDFFPQSFYREKKVTCVHFDADLYSSTLFLLSSLWWFIPEYYFIFDEFSGEEHAALRNFSSSFPVEVEFFSSAQMPGNSPAQVFGHLRKTRMVVDGIG